MTPLVEEMVESVEGARAALPLLAFAVSRLWEKRDRERKLLTRAAYEEIGGVAGALAQHAEAVMDRIGVGQEVVREIFRNLVTSQGTRAVVDRDELLSAFPEKGVAEGVLRALIDARLVTSYEVEGREGEANHHRVEVVHESLLKAWPRLVWWQAQDEEGAYFATSSGRRRICGRRRDVRTTCCGQGRPTRSSLCGAVGTRGR